MQLSVVILIRLASGATEKSTQCQCTQYDGDVLILESDPAGLAFLFRVVQSKM